MSLIRQAQSKKMFCGRALQFLLTMLTNLTRKICFISILKVKKNNATNGCVHKEVVH